MGCTVGVAMWLFGMPTPVLWGALAMLLRFVPYLGPTLAMALPVVLSLAAFEGWARPIGVVSFFIVAELIFNNVLEPLAYGSSIGVSATGVIVAVVFWTWLWGPVGLVLAMPLTVCVVIMSRYIPQMRTITILLSERSSLSIEERIYQRLLAYDDEEAACIVQGGDRVHRGRLRGGICRITFEQGGSRHRHQARCHAEGPRYGRTGLEQQRQPGKPAVLGPHAFAFNPGDDPAGKIAKISRRRILVSLERQQLTQLLEVLGLILHGYDFK
jgi:hypothetical protein